MSLLLEALKKAELAKQQNADPSKENETTLPLSARGPSSLDPGPSSEPLDLNLTTRDQLPDPNQPLEILIDDLRDQPKASELDLSLDETMPPLGASPATGSGDTTTSRPGSRRGASASTSPGLGAIDPAKPDLKEITRPPRPWDDAREERDAARQVFEAKQMDYNPRRPFYATLGLLAAAAMGSVGYFWWEMQPRSSFVAARPAASSPAPAAISSAPASAPSAIASAPAPEPQSTIPPQVIPPSLTPPPPAAAKPDAPSPATLPVTTPSSQASSTPVTPAPLAGPTAMIPSGSSSQTVQQPAAATPASRVPAASPPSTPAPRAFSPAREQRIERTNVANVPQVPVAPRPSLSAEPARIAQPISRNTTSGARAASALSGASQPSSAIAFTRNAPQLDPGVERAYTAYQSGDLESARQQYLRALQSDPWNRDAQLGLAAIDVRAQNYEGAEARYQKLLEADPRDSHAQAGLIALRGASDPVQSESRLKNMIATQPDASMLHFSLGNQYAAQSRWSEAQQAYFKAFTAEPDNPDFAFNLAVSLDQLRQRALAADYYRRALTLATQRPAAFDRELASNRARELQR